MSNYNTGNPVPSIDPRDLDDNATVFDQLLQQAVPSVPDRLGVARKTWWQMEQDALALISPNISALAGLTGAADRLAYFTGVGAMALTPLTAVARALLDDTTQAAMQSTLGLVLTTSNIDSTTGRVLKVGDYGWGSPGNASPTYVRTPGTFVNTSPSAAIQAQTTDVQATEQQPVNGELFGGVHITRTLRPAQFGVSGQGSGATLWYRGYSTASPLLADWLKAAKSGANSDITSLTGLTTPLSVAQGGTGVTTSTGTGSAVLSASPTLTGAPLAPTAAVGTNTTQLATTAMLQAEIANKRAWTSYTPTITATTGTFTTVSATGRYMVAFGVCHFLVIITVTTVGTGTKPIFTLPFPALASYAGGVFLAAESAINGKVGCAGLLTTTTAACRDSTAGDLVTGNGAVISINGSYPVS